MATSMDNSTENQLPIPRGYEYQNILAEGNFSQVIKCVKPRTRETVVVKIGKNGNDLSHEMNVLDDLMAHNMTRFNIVEFLGTVINSGKTGLVFETLDITLLDYIVKEGGHMRLEDIRKVIEQVAFALYGLKTQGLIHTNVKPDNIMLTNRNRIPLRVKLIDFGKAMYKSDVTPDMDGEPVYNRSLSAPESLLGLPFSEATDMWSLGCVLGIMLTGRTLFPDTNSHATLRSMIDLLGPPPKHLIDAGLRSKMFFEKTLSDEWILQEQPGSADDSSDNPSHMFQSLETLKAMRLENYNDTEADQRGACVDLLKEMLRWDRLSRITPNAISSHPFMTRHYHDSSPPIRSCISLPPGILMVQPAAPENSTHLEKTSDLDSEKCVLPPSTMVQPATPKKIIDLDRKKCSSLPSGIIMVQPAAPKNTRHLEKTSDLDSETRVSPPSGVIMVQPAAPEKIIDLDRKKCVTLPSGIIMVQPAAPENNIDMDEEFDEDSEASSSLSSSSDLDESPDRDNERISSSSSSSGLDESPDRDNERVYSLLPGMFVIVSPAPKDRTHLEKMSDEDSDTFSSLPSVVIADQIAVPKINIDLDEGSDEESETSVSPPSSSDEDEEMADLYSGRIFSPVFGMSMVESSAPKNGTHLEKTSYLDSETCSSPPSGIIMVQPAAPENNIDLDEESDEDSGTSVSPPSSSDLDESADRDTERSVSLPSGISMVEPAAPKNGTHLEKTSDLDSETYVSPPSGVVVVQPTAPKDSIDLDEESDEDSDAGSDLDEESDEDGETTINPDNGDLSPTTSDKKKKSRFKRCLSCMKKAFCPCCKVKDVPD